VVVGLSSAHSLRFILSLIDYDYPVSLKGYLSLFQGRRRGVPPTDWEMQVEFNPLKALCNRRVGPRWLGCGQLPPGLCKHSELGLTYEHIKLPIKCTLDECTEKDLYVRDPAHFVCGQLNKNYDKWEHILCDIQDDEMSSNIQGWLRHGEDISKYFVPYAGQFCGKFYDAALPPNFSKDNSRSCMGHVQFIASTLEEHIRDSSLTLLGKVGEVQPPKVVMPLTVEPSKPRLCHDESYLNLWIRDNPFRLATDTLRDVPGLVPQGSYMTTCDEKSAYDGIMLAESCHTYFGLQFD
jgi:hypothetical protein